MPLACCRKMRQEKFAFAVYGTNIILGLLGVIGWAVDVKANRTQRTKIQLQKATYPHEAVDIFFDKTTFAYVGLGFYVTCVLFSNILLLIDKGKNRILMLPWLYVTCIICNFNVFGIAFDMDVRDEGFPNAGIAIVFIISIALIIWNLFATVYVAVRYYSGEARETDDSTPRLTIRSGDVTIDNDEVMMDDTNVDFNYSRMSEA